MNKIKITLLILAVIGNVFVNAQDTNTDYHKVTLTIPQIALLDVEPAGSKDITMDLTAPTEAGDPLQSDTDETLWLNVTSIVAFGNTRDISAKVDVTLTGIDLKLSADAYSGSGFGSWGTPQSELTLTTSDQTLVSGIKSGYTFDGANNGYNLNFSAEPVATATFGDIVSTAGSDITVTYTLTP